MKRKAFVKWFMAVSLIMPLFVSCATAQPTVHSLPGSSSPLRIVVLPHYTEKGLESTEAGDLTIHYRRIVRFINNQLVRHGFEVINPFAADLKEEEYNRYMKRARQDSALAVREMCRRYATDVAYIVWLDVKAEHTPDGYCRVRALLDGEGYDSAGHDLGIGVIKRFIRTARYCEDAIAAAEKDVADVVGRVLTAWNKERLASLPKTDSAPSTGSGKGIVSRRAKQFENLISVRLEGATEYEVVEIFGKVLNTVRGVVEAKLYSLRLEPDNPQASTTVWRVKIEGTEPFRLQANIIKMVHDILKAGGQITINGVPYRYTPEEIEFLKGLRPGDSSSREIQFVIDRELVRDREFTSRFESERKK